MLRMFAFLSTLTAMLALPAAANAASLSQMLAGQLEWRNVGPAIGGRVVAVAGVPGGQNLFYMGGVDGGVWKSTDYGLQWTNITDGTLPGSSNSIGAIAVAPSNANVIYVGTGESDIRANFVTGDGIYRSADAGKTWHYAGLAGAHTISAIVVDAHDPNVLYASSMGHVFKPNAERGVFKSVDGGKTWRKVLFVNADTGAIDLVMDPNGVLYAAMWQAYRTPWKLDDGGPGSGLYRSSDGGAHWIDISRNPGFAHALLGRIGVSVVARNPRVVYAIVQARDGGVFRSADAGATWKRVNADWSLRQRAFYYMSIFADPTSTQTVYAPEVDALWISHNGGRTWSKLHTPHGDNHIVWVDPRNPRILLEGNDGGATVSTDGGLTWSTEHNQRTGQFYHIGIDNQFPFHIYGAQQDEGSFEGPSATSDGMIPLAAWHNVAYGESTFVAPQPDNPNVTYGSGYFSIFLRYDMATGEYSSVSPWPNYLEGASSGEQRYRFGWTHPILFSPANPSQLLIGSQYVLQSNDYGKTWQRISPDLTRNDPRTEAPSGGPVDLDQSSAEVFPDVSALAVSPLDGKVIWAGSADGLVHVTTDGGTNWTAITPPSLPQWCEITSIEPSHFASGTAYLTASRYMWDDFRPYVFETTDYGRHWTTITAGLPDDQYAFTVRQDPQDEPLLFLGTKSSLYASLDGGAHWQTLALNLPPVQVRDVAIDTRQGDVAIATHGRSFWILDNLALLEQLTREPVSSGPQIFAPATAWLSHAYGSSEYASFVQDAGENPPFGATVFFHIPSGYDGRTAVTLSFTDAQGSLVRSFTLHHRGKAGINSGMNRFLWNLRYPDATEVHGFHPPVAAGGLDDSVNGPVVVPGTYDVVLDYGGTKVRQSFAVSLDPRLHPAPDALAARLALALRVHTALNALDTDLNRAIAVRDRLRAAVTGHRLAPARAGGAIAALDSEIGNLVQLDIHSSEGDLLHESKLRSHLAYLAAELDLAYDAPTQAQSEVFDQLNGEAQTGEQRLEAAITAARQLLSS
ncbi:MAG TPA: hypothetical protein VIN40_00590 [Candidatus Tyrphobacter sp.]